MFSFDKRNWCDIRGLFEKNIVCSGSSSIRLWSHDKRKDATLHELRMADFHFFEFLPIPSYLFNVGILFGLILAFDVDALAIL